MSVGPLLRKLLRLYQDSVARAAHTGIDVVVDEVVLDRIVWHDWRATLAGIDVCWVAIRCDPAEMARRELTRGDRPIGRSAAQLLTGHDHASYDLELDTTSRTPAQLAHDIDDFGF